MNKRSVKAKIDSSSQSDMASPPMPCNGPLNVYMTQLLQDASVSQDGVTLMHDNATILCESASQSIQVAKENAARQNFKGQRRAAYTAGSSSNNLTKAISRWESYPFPLSSSLRTPTTADDNRTSLNESVSALEAPQLPQRRLSWRRRAHEDEESDSSEVADTSESINPSWPRPVSPPIEAKYIAAALSSTRAAAASGPRFPLRRGSFGPDNVTNNNNHFDTSMTSWDSSSDESDGGEEDIPTSKSQSFQATVVESRPSIRATPFLASFSSSSSSSNSSGPRLPPARSLNEMNSYPKAINTELGLTKAMSRLSTDGSEPDKKGFHASLPQINQSSGPRLSSRERLDMIEKVVPQQIDDLHTTKRGRSSPPNLQPDPNRLSPKFPQRKISRDGPEDGSSHTNPLLDVERDHVSCRASVSTGKDESLSVKKALTLMNAKRPARRTSPQIVGQMLATANVTVFSSDDEENSWSDDEDDDHDDDDHDPSIDDAEEAHQSTSSSSQGGNSHQSSDRDREQIKTLLAR